MSNAAALFLVVAALQQAPTQLVITPEATEVTVTDSTRLTLRAADASGRAVAGLQVRWFSATPEIAAVTGDGRVIGLAPGVATVQAFAAGLSTSLNLVVRPLPPAEVVVAAGTTSPYAGQAVTLRVTATDRRGDVVPDPELTYSSSAPSVASVDAAGLVFARSSGTAIIEVRGGEAVGALLFYVRPDPGLTFGVEPAEVRTRTGDVVRFRGVGVTPDGAEVAVHPEWSISGAGAQIEGDGPEGVFVAEEPGSYRVTARMGEHAVASGVVRVEERFSDAQLVQIGRGPISEYNSGDMWVFEGLDGRDYVYVGTYGWDWMKVFDVTDAQRPFVTDSVQLDARRINDVKIHPNNRLAVVTREGASSRRNGIVLLDLTDPAHPTILSEYTETVTGGVHNTWIEGEQDLVYAVHNGTRAIHIIDISDPASPSEVGRWGLENEDRSLHDVMVTDGYLYASYWDDGAVVLDVGAGTHGGTPTEPALVSQYKYPVGNTHVAWRQGRYLFVGDEIFPAQWSPDRPIEARGYIHVLDMTDVDSPVEVARYEVPEAGVHNVWAEGDRLYVGYYQGGLRVLDISGELRGDLYAQGREIAVIKTTDENAVVPNWPMTWGAQLYKGRIYSTDFNSGLWITELRERRPPVS
jgi:hypothetical protein